MDKKMFSFDELNVFGKRNALTIYVHKHLHLIKSEVERICINPYFKERFGLPTEGSYQIETDFLEDGMCIINHLSFGISKTKCDCIWKFLDIDDPSEILINMVEDIDILIENNEIIKVDIKLNKPIMIDGKELNINKVIYMHLKSLIYDFLNKTKTVFEFIKYGGYIENKIRQDKSMFDSCGRIIQS